MTEGRSPATGSFEAILNGVRIHYEVHGAGPVVMVVPNSWGITAAVLRRLYGGLEQRLTLVYFDPRGMGGSDPVSEDRDMGMETVREDFVALRRHLGLDRVVATGWSNGAMNLILLAAEHPEAISSAVFLHGAASYAEADHAAFAREHPQLVKRFERFTSRTSDPSVSDQEKNRLLRTLWLDDLLPVAMADRQRGRDRLERLFGTMEFSWQHANHSGRETTTFDWRDRLPGVTAPCLIIAGAHDTIPLAKAVDLKDGLPDARMVLFERSGHFAPLEEPAAFETAVFDFLGVR